MTIVSEYLLCSVCGRQFDTCVTGCKKAEHTQLKGAGLSEGLWEIGIELSGITTSKVCSISHQNISRDIFI